MPKHNTLFSIFFKTGGIHLIPKSVTHNVIQPTAAVTKIVAKRAATLADHFADDVKETYDKYLGEYIMFVSS